MWETDFSIDCLCGAIIEPTRVKRCHETGERYPADYPRRAPSVGETR